MKKKLVEISPEAEAIAAIIAKREKRSVKRQLETWIEDAAKKAHKGKQLTL